MSRLAALVCVTLPVCLAGCAATPVDLALRPVLARRLPPGIHMADYVQTDASGHRVTVADKLARLGACPGQDGKIYDSRRREIQFWRHPAGPVTPEAKAEADRELQALKRRCTVIEVLPEPSAGS
jgi:hypothetical protein